MDSVRNNEYVLASVGLGRETFCSLELEEDGHERVRERDSSNYRA